MFFRLPIHIRIKIHRLCGLIRLCPIDLNFENVRQRWISIHRARQSIIPRSHRCRFPRRHAPGLNFDTNLPEGLDCFCPPIPLQLLSVCQAFHDEAENVLYTRNQFKSLRHEDELTDHPLKILWTLSPRVWTMIRSLHIGLTHIDRSHECVRSDAPPMETIDARNVYGSRTIAAWMAFCENVLCQVPTGSMKFGLSCNIDDPETALRLVKSMNGLPPMAEAAMHLSADPARKDLTRIARKAVRGLTATQTKARAPTVTLSWDLLPREIQLVILGFTDLIDYYSSPNLIAPLRRDGFEVAAGKLLSRVGQCCNDCVPTRSLCNCASICAASSTTCPCPAVPIELFLVNRAMHADAKEIFFSRNRFILQGDFAASQRWLCNLPTMVARHLRMIDLELSFQQLYDMHRPNSTAVRDWENLIACIASLLLLPRLWLSVDAGNFSHLMEHMNNDGDHDFAWLHTSYANLFEPLYQHLGGARPRKFHMFLCRWVHYESTVEKIVMGLDYDSGLEGKIPARTRNDRYPHSAQRAWKLNHRPGIV